MVRCRDSLDANLLGTQKICLSQLLSNKAGVICILDLSKSFLKSSTNNFSILDSDSIRSRDSAITLNMITLRERGVRRYIEVQTIFHVFLPIDVIGQPFLHADNAYNTLQH
jgi:hypothetical protein